MSETKSIPAAERDDAFYELLAGVARTRLLESMVDLGLPALLLRRGPLTPAEIAAELDLHGHRAEKWLLLLQRVGLVREEEGRYAQSPLTCSLFWDSQGGESFFVRDMIEYCRRVNELDFAAVEKR